MIFEIKRSNNNFLLRKNCPTEVPTKHAKTDKCNDIHMGWNYSSKACTKVIRLITNIANKQH